MGVENIELETFMELVKEYEAGDPIDFGMVRVQEDDAFRIICEHILNILEKTDPENRQLVLAVALAKAMTENMILNIQRIQDVPRMSIG